jgi:group I intron endonuclease
LEVISQLKSETVTPSSFFINRIINRKKMKKCFIYKITNPKGFHYIGSTINLRDRIYRYKSLRIKQQIKIFNSIKKYGWDNHEFEVIHECNCVDRNYFEAYYGKLYNCIGENGLNLCLPKINDQYVNMSDETKIKIGNAHRGKTISEENKIKLSERSKKYIKENGHPMQGKEPWNKGISFLKGNLNPMFGVRRSEEWKKKHSELINTIKKTGDQHFKSKLVIDTMTGLFYSCVKDVSVAYGVKYSSLKQRLRLNKDNRFKYCV